jgi:hypothetical protein
MLSVLLLDFLRKRGLAVNMAVHMLVSFALESYS